MFTHRNIKYTSFNLLKINFVILIRFDQLSIDKLILKCLNLSVNP
jgi:hypothetical protein